MKSRWIRPCGDKGATHTITELKKQEFLAHGEAIALSLALALEGRDAAALDDAAHSEFNQAFIARRSEEPGIAYIYVQDAEGSIIAHTFQPHFPPEFIDLNSISPGELKAHQRVKLLEQFRFKSATAAPNVSLFCESVST